MKKKENGLVSFCSIKVFCQCALLRPVVYTLLAALFIGGCASATFIQTGQSYAAKADDCEIEVFSSKTPDREYEELGILEGEGFFGGDTMEMLLPKLKKEACKAGGDAIILKSYQKYVDEIDDANLNVTATVIRWTE